MDENEIEFEFVPDEEEVVVESRKPWIPEIKYVFKLFRKLKYMFLFRQVHEVSG